MREWSLSTLLEELHQDVQSKLGAIRRTVQHPGAKGDASEQVWIKLLRTYLPKRYSAEQAFVVDSAGGVSQQIDVVIFDRQYTPFIFEIGNAKYVPAEGVYGVFEAKQAINADYVDYAVEKARSVRALHQTSLPIPHAGGVYDPKPPINIVSGILTFESDWSPKLGASLFNALSKADAEYQLDLGCVAAHGIFTAKPNKTGHEIAGNDKAVTAFLFKLIAVLQTCGTVPMIDIEAYGKWLYPQT